MAFKFNPFTGTLDYYVTGTDLGCLLLDQTTPQEVINGSPEFDEGIKIRAGKKVIFDGP